MRSTLQNTIAVLLLLLAEYPLSFGQDTPSTIPPCEELVFSDVHHIGEVDDYVGTEIIINLCAGVADLKGAWNEYEGYYPVTESLTGQKTGTSIQLYGKNSEREVRFTGQLKGERLIGQLIWHIGNSRQQKTIDISRTRQPVRPPK